MSMTHDGCDVQQGSVDVGRPVCVHSHMTMCTPLCKCLQLMTKQLQPGEAGTDDAGVPVAPAISYTTHMTYNSHHTLPHTRLCLTQHRSVTRAPRTIHCHTHDCAWHNTGLLQVLVMWLTKTKLYIDRIQCTCSPTSTAPSICKCHTPKEHRWGAHLPFIQRWTCRWINHYCLWRMASATPDLWLPSQPKLVLIVPTHGGMARLSWPGWLVT